jgi:hypothetical protein
VNVGGGSVPLLIREGVEPVDEPLGMDPAQAVLADIELTGIVADDDGVGQEATRCCCSSVSERRMPRMRAKPFRSPSFTVNCRDSRLLHMILTKVGWLRPGGRRSQPGGPAGDAGGWSKGIEHNRNIESRGQSRSVTGAPVLAPHGWEGAVLS